VTQRIHTGVVTGKETILYNFTLGADGGSPSAEEMTAEPEWSK